MSLDDLLASDAAAVFLNGDDFAEPVTVGTDGGSERTVYAIVDRTPPAKVDGGGNMRAPNLRFVFANDPVKGIDVTTFNTGKAYVTYPREKGGAETMTQRLYGKPTAQDAGMVTFEV